MSTQVNSPFMLAKLRPIKDMTANENNYHEQIERILQQLYRRMGGAVDVVSQDDTNIDLLSRLAYLEARVSSGDALTWDETGFSWDSNKLSFDQTEA